MSLVRTLVLGETDIAIDPKQRSPVRLGICHQPCADISQPELQVGDKAKTRLARKLFEFRAMFQKPGTPVVTAQLFQKLKES
jgi:hypothetical protein